MTNDELTNIVSSIKYNQVKIAVEAVNAEKNGDKVERRLKEELMQLTMIGNALVDYDIDYGLFSESEIRQLIRDANDITLKYANNSVY